MIAPVLIMSYVELDETDLRKLLAVLLGEPEPDAWSDPRTPEEIERDLFDAEWKQTYDDLRAGL